MSDWRAKSRQQALERARAQREAVERAAREDAPSETKIGSSRTITQGDGGSNIVSAPDVPSDEPETKTEGAAAVVATTAGKGGAAAAPETPAKEREDSIGVDNRSWDPVSAFEERTRQSTVEPLATGAGSSREGEAGAEAEAEAATQAESAPGATSTASAGQTNDTAVEPPKASADITAANDGAAATATPDGSSLKDPSAGAVDWKQQRLERLRARQGSASAAAGAGSAENVEQPKEHREMGDTAKDGGGTDDAPAAPPAVAAAAEPAAPAGAVVEDNKDGGGAPLAAEGAEEQEHGKGEGDRGVPLPRASPAAGAQENADDRSEPRENDNGNDTSNPLDWKAKRLARFRALSGKKGQSAEPAAEAAAAAPPPPPAQTSAAPPPGSASSTDLAPTADASDNQQQTGPKAAVGHTVEEARAPLPAEGAGAGADLSADTTPSAPAPADAPSTSTTPSEAPLDWKQARLERLRARQASEGSEGGATRAKAARPEDTDNTKAAAPPAGEPTEAGTSAALGEKKGASAAVDASAEGDSRAVPAATSDSTPAPADPSEKVRRGSTSSQQTATPVDAPLDWKQARLERLRARQASSRPADESDASTPAAVEKTADQGQSNEDAAPTAGDAPVSETADRSSGVAKELSRSGSTVSQQTATPADAPLDWKQARLERLRARQASAKAQVAAGSGENTTAAVAATAGEPPMGETGSGGAAGTKAAVASETKAGVGGINENAVVDETNPNLEAVRALLSKHDPKKAKMADDLLARYAGREDLLLATLTSKYERDEPAGSAERMEPEPAATSAAPLDESGEGGPEQHTAASDATVPPTADAPSEDAADESGGTLPDWKQQRLERLRARQASTKAAAVEEAASPTPAGDVLTTANATPAPVVREPSDVAGTRAVSHAPEAAAAQATDAAATAAEPAAAAVVSSVQPPASTGPGGAGAAPADEVSADLGPAIENPAPKPAPESEGDNAAGFECRASSEEAVRKSVREPSIPAEEKAKVGPAAPTTVPEKGGGQHEGRTQVAAAASSTTTDEQPIRAPDPDAAAAVERQSSGASAALSWKEQRLERLRAAKAKAAGASDTKSSDTPACGGTEEHAPFGDGGVEGTPPAVGDDKNMPITEEGACEEPATAAADDANVHPGETTSAVVDEPAAPVGCEAGSEAVLQRAVERSVVTAPSAGAAAVREASNNTTASGSAAQRTPSSGGVGDWKQQRLERLRAAQTKRDREREAVTEQPQPAADADAAPATKPTAPPGKPSSDSLGIVRLSSHGSSAFSRCSSDTSARGGATTQAPKRGEAPSSVPTAAGGAPLSVEFAPAPAPDWKQLRLERLRAAKERQAAASAAAAAPPAQPQPRPLRSASPDGECPPAGDVSTVHVLEKTQPLGGLAVQGAVDAAAQSLAAAAPQQGGPAVAEEENPFHLLRVVDQPREGAHMPAPAPAPTGLGGPPLAPAQHHQTHREVIAALQEQALALPDHGSRFVVVPADDRMLRAAEKRLAADRVRRKRDAQRMHELEVACAKSQREEALANARAAAAERAAVERSIELDLAAQNQAMEAEIMQLTAQVQEMDANIVRARTNAARRDVGLLEDGIETLSAQMARCEVQSEELTARLLAMLGTPARGAPGMV